MSLTTTRRSFLKASLMASAAFLLPEKVLASPSMEIKPSGRLNLYNTHTFETVRTTYRNKHGHYDFQSIRKLNWLLRCHYTGDQYPIDIKTLEFLDVVSTQLGGDNEIHIISGYRSPEYNNYLLSNGHRVGRQSLHMEGRALDVRIPGISLSNLHSTALSLRIGGVGYYPTNDFVHIDSGAFRTW